MNNSITKTIKLFFDKALAKIEISSNNLEILPEEIETFS